MQFALLGDHPHGLDMAKAMVESGNFRLRYFSGSIVGEDYLRRWDLPFQKILDSEEILAKPEIQAVIVAVDAGDRPVLLRRALQSEKHVLCVHPADNRPEGAYEADIVQSETGRVLMPLLPEVFHPGFTKLANIIAKDRHRYAPNMQPGLPRLLQMERRSTEALIFNAGSETEPPAFPIWDVLQLLGGRVVEVSSMAAIDSVQSDAPILISGCYEQGGLFQVTLLPFQSEAKWHVLVQLHNSQARLEFPTDWPGPSSLHWQNDKGEPRQQEWESWNPWPQLVEQFQQSLDRFFNRAPDTDRRLDRPNFYAGLLSWEEEIRCLELDEAARRSVERRRSSTLEYQEAIEEASFKGSMTLIGCGLLWGCLILLIVSRWIPWIGWSIFPLLLLFLVLQFFRGDKREDSGIKVQPKEKPQEVPRDEVPKSEPEVEERVFRKD